MAIQKSRPTQVRLGSRAREELATKLEVLHCTIARLKQQREGWSKIQRAWPVETFLGAGKTAVIKEQKRPRVISNVYRASRSYPGRMCRLELQGHAPIWRVVIDPILERMDEDCAREIGRLELEGQGIKQLLNPPMGRPQERLYAKALLEKEENPSLTARLLAEKYLPRYFPQHAEAATDAMRHGLATARKRKGARKRP